MKISIAKAALEQVLQSLANDDPADPGLLLATEMLLAGLEEIDGGLNEMKTGIDDQMVPGLEEILAGLDNDDPETPGISQGLASVEAGLTGEIAVSYTHLDVYKRQGPRR